MAQAFEEFIGSHLDDLYSAALCLTLDEGRAADLIQEAAIRVLQEQPHERRGADYRHLMLGSLVSVYLQRQRRQGHDPLAAVSGLHDEAARASEGQPVGPFPELGSPGYGRLVEWFARAWVLLDDADRVILWLADVERLRHRRVAELTGLGLEEVRARHYRARRTLSRGAARELSRRAAGRVKAR